jgi:hypothetical protein
VDQDGKDEIVYGSMVVDHDGTGLFSTGLRHGDALHVSDLVPSRPGLEVWSSHENENITCATGPGLGLYDARTGEIIFSKLPDIDVSRAVAADIDPRYFGAEFWGGDDNGSTKGYRLYDSTGADIGPAPPQDNMLAWWDADLLRELVTGTTISKWNWLAGTQSTLLSASGTAANNSNKSVPAFVGDILGDWREEVVWRASNNQSLRIYTTTIPATNRLYTLLQDPQYRLSLVWQNVAYNQPPWPSFYLGTDMVAPLKPNIVYPVTISGGITAKSGTPNARVWTIGVTNSGTAPANAGQIQSFSLAQTFGAACTPVLTSPAAFPIPLGNIAPGATAAASLTIDFSSCSTLARFRATAPLSAMESAATSLMVVNNQYR